MYFNNILTKAKVLKVLENGNALLLLFLGTNITQIISSDRVKLFLFEKCDRELPVCLKQNFNVPLEFKYITDGTIAKCLLLNYIPNIPIL